ncbi:MAG: DUF1549 domain-containing protein [Planctomycetaceae bacterium]|nr:DUF1549 domain-containing protein [Planctomycetaceae bacterium]
MRALFLLFLFVSPVAVQAASVDVSPFEVTLTGMSNRQQLVVTRTIDGDISDVTRQASYVSDDANVATIDERGVIRAVGQGSAVIRVDVEGLQQSVAVTVRDLGEANSLDFERDIQPILTRHACNSGPCHGKARGQNGFQLSLFGFDSDFDHQSLVKEARGRRVFFAAPEESLLLTKPTGIAPHGGGVRLEVGGEAYEMLRRWIAAGAPRRQPDTPTLTGVTIKPEARVLPYHASQQLQVTAHYSDDSMRDVTHMATYQSNESAIAAVDETGLVTASEVTGETAVMARYQGHFAVFTPSVPLPGDVPSEYYDDLPRRNFIDEHVYKGLERLSLTLSDTAPDHKFLRRAYVDIIGRVPTVEEARTFLDDLSPEKRDQLVDHLLAQPEYAEHWANKWADLLRPNPYRVGIKTVLNYDNWIRSAFRRNQPYDEFVRELITAEGSTWKDGHVTLYRDRRSPDEITTMVSQLFLGIRLECAKCHHHPFEVWGQEDFYSFAAFFAKLGYKGTGLSPPISGSEEMVFAGTSGNVTHPLTNVVMEPRPLFGDPVDVPADGDPRDALAAWLTSDDNPFFAQTMANRVWADIMGRGLVEPVDDLRATNPPSNTALLTALGNDFRDSGFDLKHLIRTITTSHIYGLSSLPTDRNAVDTRNFSRHYRVRLRAEVLADSWTQIVGMPQTYKAMPPGASAKEIWTHRVESQFLDTFGRPDPNQDPPCERTTDTTVVQALHLMNANDLHAKLVDDASWAAKLAESEIEPAQIVANVYLAVYSRLPDEEELQIALDLYDNEGSGRRTVTEDLLWALLNTPEFVFED